ncbi:hypothetical protein OG564_03665 [Streptomyces sp. NBC_01280]|uniref:hypothetical protein n=1 Tax=Streptomyces sp. NBC_01280 TaxID=2903810 RepID=UPI002E342584|nr:hypothetical protein [Streptomyces sp. NBC_01280]
MSTDSLPDVVLRRPVGRHLFADADDGGREGRGRLAARVGDGDELAPPGIPMVLYLAEQEVRTGRGGKSVMSCLLPGRFEGRAAGVAAPFANSFPDDVRQRVVADWANYGYPDVS